MNWSQVLWLMGILLCLLQCVMWSLAAEPLDDWSGKVETATSHKHWERIVKRRSLYERYSGSNEDDTSHIVNVQEYYRIIFDQGWDDYGGKEKELFHMLGALEKVLRQGHPTDKEVTAQEDNAHSLELGVRSKRIRGRYIVMFQSAADNYLLDRTMKIMEKANRESNRRIRATDMHALRYIGKGFTATLNRKALALLQVHPLLAHIEEDTALRRSEASIHEEEEEDKATVSKSVPWNLDRIDQRRNVLDQEYNPAGDGRDVDIYIIDTGVKATHQEFEGRVHYAGFDAVDHLTGSNNNGRDCNGHGTHCAGTAAGKTYGVAKKANIYNLRALNCKGTGAVSGIVMGIDKIIKKHKESSTGRPIVISQSLGVKKSLSLNTAIQKAVEEDITMVGAAGNQGSYSCNYSPPSARVGIAVGATDKRDQVTVFTNLGECTDIMAPGRAITSASIQCDTCTKTMSGTSMATPHAAGAAAIILSHNPQMTATEVKKRMIADSTKNVMLMSAIANTLAMRETPNRLLYVRNASAKSNDDSIVSAQDFISRP